MLGLILTVIMVTVTALSFNPMTGAFEPLVLLVGVIIVSIGYLASRWRGIQR